MRADARLPVAGRAATAVDDEHGACRRGRGRPRRPGPARVAVRFRWRRSTSVCGPPVGPNVVQYQSTTSPSFSTTVSAPTRGRDAVDLEDPAVRALALVAADLVDERAERELRDVVVELAAGAGGVERVQGVGAGRRQRRLGRAVDRLRLAFDAHAARSRRVRPPRAPRRGRPATARIMSRRSTNPPSARGSGCRQAVGLLTRGSPLAAFPARGPVASSARSNSPYSGGTVPDLHRIP